MKPKSIRMSEEKTMKNEDYRLEVNSKSVHLFKGKCKLGFASKKFDGLWYWIPWNAVHKPSRKGRDLVACLAKGASLSERLIKSLFQQPETLKTSR